MDLFDDEAQDYLQNAQNNLANINAPTATQLQVSNVPLESVQGTINPEQVNAITENPNQVQQANLNAPTQQEQQNAISGEQEIANAGGLDANAQLGIQEATQASNNALAGNLGAIMQNAQATGEGNSGAQLAERLQAAQGSANNLQNQDLQAAAEAEQNRENAIANVGNLASGLQGQQLNAAQVNAGALNNVAAQNTATQNAAENTNVANNLTGQTTNLQNAQNVNAANATAGQNQAYYNAQAPQTQFNDQLAKATGQANVAGTQAQTATQQSAANDALIGGLVGSAGKIGAAALAAKGGVVKKLTLEDLMKKKTGLLPGKEIVKGNSKKNDVIPVLASAGELVVPKETVEAGPDAIKDFAKHPPVAGTDKKVKLEDLFKKKVLK